MRKKVFAVRFVLAFNAYKQASKIVKKFDVVITEQVYEDEETVIVLCFDELAVFLDQGLFVL